MTVIVSFDGDKVSLLTDTYPQKTLGKIEVAIAISRLTVHVTCGLMSD